MQLFYMMDKPSESPQGLPSSPLSNLPDKTSEQSKTPRVDPVLDNWNDGITPVYDLDDVRRVTDKAWKEPYKGDAAKLFVEELHATNNFRTPTPYNNTVVVIQSSGMGKSRMANEAAKSIFTLPFNLRSNRDKSAHPPPNAEVRLFFNATQARYMSKYELEYRYLQFFKHLFDLVNAKLLTLAPCETYEDYALAWYNEFTEGVREALYHEAVEASWPELKTYRNDQETLDNARKAVNASVQVLLATIIKNSELRGTASSELIKDDSSGSPVRMMLSFDSLQELVDNFTKASEGDRPLSAYQVLCKSLNSIIEQDVMAVYLSTDPTLTYHSPQEGDFREFELSYPPLVRPSQLPAPFVELSFDAFADVKEDEITLERASKTEHMVQFGRPLFYATFKSSNRSDMIGFAIQKLNAHPSDINKEGQLAALCIRLLLEFEPWCDSAREKEALLVAGHMRVVYSAPKHRLYFRSGAPSEPLLAEASGHILNDIKAPIYTHSIFLLSLLLRNDIISSGAQEKLVGRLILTLAHDKAILENDGRQHFSRPIGVLAFLKALLSPQYFERVKKSKPANVLNGQTLEEAFADAQLNFTHFVQGGDTTIVSDDFAWMALARCMAFVCANSQRTIDLYIPILLWGGKLGRWVVSGIFIQIGKCSPQEERVVIDATKLGFFAHADPAKIGVDLETAQRYNTRPYITIVMDFGVKASKVGPSKVAPTQAQPQRGTNGRSMHPRYAINIIGRSSNIYHAVPLFAEDSLVRMLTPQDIFHEHPRKEEGHVDAVLSMKPYWAKNANSFHWAGGDPDFGEAVGNNAEDVFVDGVDDDGSDVDMLGDCTV